MARRVSLAEIGGRTPAAPVIVVAPLTDPAGYFGDLCEGVTRCNQRYLRERAALGEPIPPLYRSGIRYALEKREAFLCIPGVMMRGWGDCDDLACWRAAELREGGDPGARVFVRPSRSGVAGRWHAIVQRGDGSFEDPSARLGMATGRKGGD